MPPKTHTAYHECDLRILLDVVVLLLPSETELLLVFAVLLLQCVHLHTQTHVEVGKPNKS